MDEFESYEDVIDAYNGSIFTLNAYDRPDIIPNDENTIEATG